MVEPRRELRLPGPSILAQNPNSVTVSRALISLQHKTLPFHMCSVSARSGREINGVLLISPTEHPLLTALCVLVLDLRVTAHISLKEDRRTGNWCHSKSAFTVKASSHSGQRHKSQERTHSAALKRPKTFGQAQRCAREGMPEAGLIVLQGEQMCTGRDARGHANSAAGRTRQAK